jgi:hypothetical protein
MTISTKVALDALQHAGLIQTWKWILEGEGSVRETIPLVRSASLSVDDETYGDKSMLYFYCKTQEIADRAAKTLLAIGGMPNFNWTPDNSKCFELPVSYFKGQRHWE